MSLPKSYLVWCALLALYAVHADHASGSVVRTALGVPRAQPDCPAPEPEPRQRFLLPAGPYVPYSFETELERAACAESVHRKKLSGRIDRAVVSAAAEQLNLPMGSGRFLSVRGRAYLFCLEPHYHSPGSGRGPEGWHKGVTVYDGA